MEVQVAVVKTMNQARQGYVKMTKGQGFFLIIDSLVYGVVPFVLTQVRSLHLGF